MQVTINVAMASLMQASRWAEALYLQAGEESCTDDLLWGMRFLLYLIKTWTTLPC